MRADSCLPMILLKYHYNMNDDNTAHIIFGDYEVKGEYAIWLEYMGKYYVLFPNSLVEMLLHRNGSMVASCKAGDIWNGNSVYYSDVVDYYDWILADSLNKEATYITLHKIQLHKEIKAAFQELYKAFIDHKKVVYKRFGIDAAKTYVEEIDLILYINTHWYKSYESSRVQQVSFKCEYDVYDITYTLGLGEHHITSCISDWSSNLSLLRHQLEACQNIKLLCEDSPTTISFPGNCDLFDNPRVGNSTAVTEILPNEFVDSPILAGICDQSQVIEAIYEGLLRMARFKFPESETEETWDNVDNLTFYNKIKSPVIEDIISHRYYKNAELECRQVVVKHIVTLEPNANGFYKDEQNVNRPLLENGKIVLQFVNGERIEIEIPGFENWYKTYDVTVKSSLEPFESQGKKFLRQLRTALPDTIDLWYQSPLEVSEAILIYKHYTKGLDYLAYNNR